MSAYNVGIVGATGAVGQEILALLAARNFPIAELRPKHRRGAQESKLSSEAKR